MKPSAWKHPAVIPGVIHAGIYYQPGSLKARCCLRGKQLLYDYCENRQVATSRCGKLIVATSNAQLEQLRALKDNANKTGLDDLRWLDQAQVHELEPDVRACAGLYSPSTGIIDVHELMLALLADLEGAGGVLVTQSKVLGGRAIDTGLELTVENGGKFTFEAKTVINTAGHGAVGIARKISGLAASKIPTIYPVRGHYFEHSGKLPFEHLVYPLPGTTNLGIHVTMDLTGQMRFGPDNEFFDTVDYRFDESRKAKFTESVKAWYPELDETRLQPGFVGVRPSLQGPGQPRQDFIIQGAVEHGIDGLINLFGIDSPGLTACMALAEKTLEKLNH